METITEKPIAARKKMSRVRQLLLIGSIVIAFYTLSFGPISRLTVTIITASDSGIQVVREAPFPTWGRWTHIVYRPLFAVEIGQAGHLPRQMLSWYVNLWMFGHQP